MSTDDIVAITQLVLRERDGRAQRYWDEMKDVFHPDAEINISWMKGNRDAFIEGSRKRSPAEGALIADRLEPILVRVKSDRAVATMGCTLSLRADVDGVEVDLDQFTKLLYRAERREGQWKLMGLTGIYERDKLTPTIPGVPLSIDPHKIQDYRRSYRLFSYVHGKRGHPMKQDLPGNGKIYLNYKIPLTECKQIDQTS